MDGSSGYISLRAVHWLARNRIPTFLVDFDGSLISSILPPISIKADLRTTQIQACSDPKKKFNIAKSIVRAKLARNLLVLDWLAQRYDIESKVRLTKHEALQLSKAHSVSDLRTTEGRVALKYW